MGYWKIITSGIVIIITMIISVIVNVRSWFNLISIGTSTSTSTIYIGIGTRIVVTGRRIRMRVRMRM